MIKNIFSEAKPLILIADDSKFMRFTLRKFLEEDRYEVIEAENGTEVLSLFMERKPNIILMDFMMPEIDGATACAKLQQLPGGIDTPVIMITSLEDENSVNLAFEAGATDYISKPINWPVLRKRLSRLIHAQQTKKSGSK